MNYRFTVPPTNEQGSHTGVCSGSLTETYRQNALWDYNSARAHDGLPPVSRMPAGTRYEPIKPPRKWLTEYIVQGRYAHGWEDVTAEETRKEALQRLKEYRENEPQYPHRLIARRVRNEVSA